MEIKSTYLVDSHCHLNFQDFNDDFEQVLLRAEESNVKIMVSISTNSPSSPARVKLRNCEIIRPTLYIKTKVAR